MNYFGELNRVETALGTTPNFTRPSFGVYISKKVKPQWNIRFSYIWGVLRGDDAVAADPLDVRHRFRYMRNAHFRNYIHEMSLTAVYEFISNARFNRIRTYDRRRLVNAYLLAGIGIFRHNPQAKTPLDLGGEWISLRDLGTEGQGRPGYRRKYSLWQPTIPIGFGLKVKLTNNINLRLEVGGRITFTDFLDDVSGNYPALEDLSPLARAMSYRTTEPIAAVTGESRLSNIERFSEATGLGLISYIGKDGETYEVFDGYGRPGEIRGSPSTNDFYIVTGIHVNYIFGKR